MVPVKDLPYEIIFIAPRFEEIHGKKEQMVMNQFSGLRRGRDLALWLKEANLLLSHKLNLERHVYPTQVKMTQMDFTEQHWSLSHP